MLLQILCQHTPFLMQCKNVMPFQTWQIVLHLIQLEFYCMMSTWREVIGKTCFWVGGNFQMKWHLRLVGFKPSCQDVDWRWEATEQPQHVPFQSVSLLLTLVGRLGEIQGERDTIYNLLAKVREGGRERKRRDWGSGQSSNRSGEMCLFFHCLSAGAEMRTNKTPLHLNSKFTKYVQMLVDSKRNTI